MSFNIGDSNSRYVVVNNAIMKFNVSEKIIFADLCTSQKTGKVILDKNNNSISERIYSNWEGRFVGGAFEAAKGLRNGQAIDIINGWISKEDVLGKNNKKYTNIYVTITDFCLSDSDDEDDKNILHMENNEGRE